MVGSQNTGMEGQPLDLLPERSSDAAKGDAGYVAVVSGNRRYTNTPAIVALGALRAGADLAKVASPETAADITASHALNIVAEPLEGERLEPGHVEKVLKVVEESDCLAIGPGLGADDGTMEAVKKILSEREIPAVVDADAIQAVGDDHDLVGEQDVLTPHRGEFEALTGSELPQELAERESAVENAAEELETTVVLKGPTDYIASPDQLALNTVGNRYMARGGTGDILTGITAAFLARGMEAFDAARAAAYLNGVAGEAALTEHGEGFLLEEMLEHVSGSIPHSP